jgi:ankyrin repeat protein
MSKPVSEASEDMIPLCLAAAGGHRNAAECLIQEKFDVSGRHRGLSPLHFASKAGNEDVIRFLVDKGANMSGQDETGMTPLHWATKGGFREIVKPLLNEDVNLDSRDDDTFTPLHWAAKEGSKNVVQLSLSKHVAIESRSEHGLTLLH